MAGKLRGCSDQNDQWSATLTSAYKIQNEVFYTLKWSYEVSDAHGSATDHWSVSTDHWSDSTDHWSNHITNVGMYIFPVEMT